MDAIGGTATGAGDAPSGGSGPGDGVPGDDPVFTAARAAIRAAEPRYRKGMRRTVNQEGFIEPAPFCDDLLARALADRAFLATATRRRFFRAATADARSALTAVLAAHDHLARGEKTDALDYLDLALTLDQEDLYAQRLYFENRGGYLETVPPARRFCPHPFERLESFHGGRVMFCCPAWLPVTIGSFESMSADEIWNSTPAQDIRASILDGSFRYCSRMHCPMFTADALPHVDRITDPEHQRSIAERRTTLPHAPRRVSLCHDRSCNLSCPSCRTRVIMANQGEAERLNTLTETSLMPLIRGARRVTITGSGDPFASRHYRWVIRSLTGEPEGQGPIIDLQTHGLLIERSWDELGLEGRVGNVLVSIDAATAPTYAVIRRGGDFAQLLDNLAFLQTLRAEGRVTRVRLDFVVQALNFREMPAAAALMRRHGFDGIKFQMLRSWRTWSTDDFARHHVGNPNHPEHGDFQRVLADPALAGADVEFYGFYGEGTGLDA